MDRYFKLRWLVPLAIVIGAAFTIGLKFPVDAKHGYDEPGSSCVPAGYAQVYNSFGRCRNHGYATGMYYTYNLNGLEGTRWWWGGNTDIAEPDMDQEGINNATIFIQKVRERLFNTSWMAACGGEVRAWNSCTHTKRRSQGAAFLVNTMLGKSGTKWGCNAETYSSENPQQPDPYGGSCVRASVNEAIADFDKWASLVQAYEALGRVNFNQSVFYGANHINTVTMRYGHDSFFFVQANAETANSIVFTHPNGSQYIIKKFCGNVTGAANPFDFNLTSQFTTTVPGNLVVRGGTYQLDVRLTNSGAPAGETFFRVQNQNANFALAPVDDVMSEEGNPDPSYGTGRGYFASANAMCSTNASAARHPCWAWKYSLFPHLTSQNTWFKFRVADNAPTGQQLCFQVFNSLQTGNDNEWGNSAGEVRRYCVTVVEPRAPFVSTDRGSVHGGARFDAEPCFEPSISQGSVTGQVKNGNGSKADYVVSAGGDIRNFGSGGIPTSNALTFANNATLGGYGRVCRPDIAKDALEDHVLDGQTVNNFASSNFSVSAIPNGLSYHVGNVVIHAGTLNQGSRKTLVVQGDVEITGNFSFFGGPYSQSDPSNRFKDIPSLGIIATGNIHIHPGVSSLYGIFYAGSTLDETGGVINTCRTGTGRNPDPPAITLNAAACNNQLQVNGALIANNIYFRRTFGNAKTGTAPAENISYLPQLLLRPPLGLSGLANQVRSQGERPPVF